VYKTLGEHDPHSTQLIDEYDELYDLDPAWHICSPTPDALHVCAAYPWAAYALVFADGSAHFTAHIPQLDPYKTPGEQLQESDCLNGAGGRVRRDCRPDEEGKKGQYGIHAVYDDDFFCDAEDYPVTGFDPVANPGLVFLLGGVTFRESDVLISRKIVEVRHLSPLAAVAHALALQAAAKHPAAVRSYAINCTRHFLF
jgi:hypothetical protein